MTNQDSNHEYSLKLHSYLRELDGFEESINEVPVGNVIKDPIEKLEYSLVKNNESLKTDYSHYVELNAMNSSVDRSKELKRALYNVDLAFERIVQDMNVEAVDSMSSVADEIRALNDEHFSPSVPEPEKPVDKDHKLTFEDIEKAAGEPVTLSPERGVDITKQASKHETPSLALEKPNLADSQNEIVDEQEQKQQELERLKKEILNLTEVDDKPASSQPAISQAATVPTSQAATVPAAVPAPKTSSSANVPQPIPVHPPVPVTQAKPVVLPPPGLAHLSTDDTIAIPRITREATPNTPANTSTIDDVDTKEMPLKGVRKILRNIKAPQIVPPEAPAQAPNVQVAPVTPAPVSPAPQPVQEATGPDNSDTVVMKKVEL
jgi:hypothetical protein